MSSGSELPIVRPITLSSILVKLQLIVKVPVDFLTDTSTGSCDYIAKRTRRILKRFAAFHLRSWYTHISTHRLSPSSFWAVVMEVVVCRKKEVGPAAHFPRLREVGMAPPSRRRALF
ncbi:unnamed protein product [Amoebophrya sp. A25]|nr:unnamed protein product [Amoebophrya sp. A25]|eukprot:GSA25T00023378001.1